MQFAGFMVVLVLVLVLVLLLLLLLAQGIAAVGVRTLGDDDR